jgi:hypothetical protein
VGRHSDLPSFDLQILERTSRNWVSHYNFKNLGWVFNPNSRHCLAHVHTVSVELTGACKALTSTHIVHSTILIEPLQLIIPAKLSNAGLRTNLTFAKNGIVKLV